MDSRQPAAKVWQTEDETNGELTAPSAASADSVVQEVSGLQVQPVHTVFQIHTLLDLLWLAVVTFSTWILSTIIYPLDPIHHHISVGSYPQGLVSSGESI
jgi:hypothetical protein